MATYTTIQVSLSLFELSIRVKVSLICAIVVMEWSFLAVGHSQNGPSWPALRVEVADLFGAKSFGFSFRVNIYS